MNEFNYKAFLFPQRETLIEYQTESNVPPNIIYTILSFTNNSSMLYLEAIGGTSTVRSEWFIYINNVVKLKRRLSVATPFIEIPLYDTPLNNGDIIDVKVRHYAKDNQDFESEVRYFR